MAKENVKISYGHGRLYDGKESELSLFTKVENGQTLAALASVKDDVFDIEATVSVGSKVGYYYNTANLGLSTTSFKKIRVRYKCSNGSVMAGVMVVFSDAVTQVILNNTNSTTWKVISATLTTGKTLDHIELFCNEAVGHVYYDFALVYKDDFTLPNTRFSRRFSVPMRNARQQPPSMFGAVSQQLGSELAIVELQVDLDNGTWTRAGDSLPGQVFLDIAQNADVEDWQWLDLGDMVAQFRVMMDEPAWDYTVEHKLDLKLTEYTRMDLADMTEIERWALDA